ncbi:MAG: YerC/YecD family TrpR-related protein [Candidatus Gracilibacteria bacterium]
MIKDWMTIEMRDLFRTMAELKNEREVAMFLRDVATMRELNEMAKRWRAAQMINAGRSYRKVAKETGLSTATVTRVAAWLNGGEGGYRLLIDRLPRPHHIR